MAQARNVFVFVTQLLEQPRLGQPAGHVQAPQRAQFSGDVGFVVKHGEQLRVNVVRFAGHGPLLQQAPRLPHVPIVFVPLQANEFGIVELGEIRGGRSSPPPALPCVRDLVDSPRRAMHAVVFVTLADVRPVGQEHAAVGAIGELDAAEPGIGGEQKVGLVLAHVRSALALERIAVEPGVRESWR